MFTFKNQKPIALVVKTAPEDLEFCDVCGGINARARTAAKIDCTECGGTGYKNPYQSVLTYASYRPGAQKRWNASSGAVDYFGECSIKLDYKYKGFLDRTEYIFMDGINWKFQTLREPGEALGQHRIVLALSRK